MPKFVCVRIIALVTIILAMIVLAICGWTLANTMRHEEVETQEYNLINSNNLSNFTSGNEGGIGLYENRTILKFDKNSKTKNGDSDSDILWNTMTKHYKVLIQTCVGNSIFVTMIQLIVSVTLLFTTAKNMKSRMRFWQLSHFIVILILSICILVPLSYNRKKDTFRGTQSFAKYMKKEIINFYQIISNQKNSMSQFLVYGLNFYYFIISFDVVILFLFIIMSCICLNCCNGKSYDHNPRVYNPNDY